VALGLLRKGGGFGLAAAVAVLVAGVVAGRIANDR
jgi:hypothetical protein